MSFAAYRYGFNCQRSLTKEELETFWEYSGCCPGNLCNTQFSSSVTKIGEVLAKYFPCFDNGEVDPKKVHSEPKIPLIASEMTKKTIL